MNEFSSGSDEVRMVHGHRIQLIGWLEGGSRYVVAEHAACLEQPHMTGKAHMSLKYAALEALHCQWPVQPRPISRDAQRVIGDRVASLEAERMEVRS